MRVITSIVFLLCALCAKSQSHALPQPNLEGCFKEVNMPPTWAATDELIVIPSYQVQTSLPVLDTVNVTVITKEAATHTYRKCLPDGSFKYCTDIIPAQTYTYSRVYEVVPAQFITVPAQTTVITRMIKVRDGYVATVPCN